ncbi:hypothetical protein C5L38_09245 [Streptomyces sp. WAC00288]|uniref:hypothetical protein n=1 Tax=unclassified Streptomyces TaxID=2593676 RepID=UPI0007879C35|nr:MULTISPECIES: hypothetical protein [unclassified Streptomyces]AVH95235.1 hypothetical protein C5L38_09245 [Streptomyces sp. WAC00288]KYG53929.1 hypothetical protein AWI43_05130 [Streptomyces sp. WAC04657]
MNDDLMGRAAAALADEDHARQLAKARELLAADEKAQKAADLKARQDQTRAEVKAMMAANDVTLEHVASKFDAAVAALAALAQAASHREATIYAANMKMQSAQLPEARGRTSDVTMDGEVHHVNDAPPRVLLARALAIAASAEGTSNNGFDALVTDLTRLAGPLRRTTKAEEIRR